MVAVAGIAAASFVEAESADCTATSAGTAVEYTVAGAPCALDSVDTFLQLVMGGESFQDLQETEKAVRDGTRRRKKLLLDA